MQTIIQKHTDKGTYFFDYGNAFLLEASRAGADIMAENKIDFKYPSYVQDILGPLCFDYGFGPFRWVCASGKEEDLDRTDAIALSSTRRNQYDRSSRNSDATSKTTSDGFGRRKKTKWLWGRRLGFYMPMPRAA